MSNVACPLCSGTSQTYYVHKEREFFKCSLCLSVFLNPKDYISAEAELAHYNRHNNDPEDVRYQNFVMPIVSPILENFTKEHKGLDFGSGSGSPIMKLLKDANYNIRQYDLFYHNYPEVLQQQYDYIACSETAEHFKEPHKEFTQLRNLLKPGGTLYIMTLRYNPAIDFGNWFYKTDPTHVFLYSDEAFEWIRQEFGFKSMVLEGRVAVLGL
ncbi:class I SAM-dependent methyltransferase [Flavobacterium sp. RHBU_24]|uniref:class I SAM-dependent methyltransferase n=1 Tax=Flavobacterium sp. RHBU_24 TaxID=3391185 RepID=UPI003984DE51